MECDVLICVSTGQVEDDGRTEVPPGTKTVLALGGISEIVDSVTGHLRLLK